VPWTCGGDHLLSSPERFLRSPGTWFADCAAFGATITVGPSSALQLAVRSARAAPPSGRLRLKAIMVGAERVEWRALREAVDVLGPAGLRMDAFMPAYGLAEATLAVTAVRLEEAPRALQVATRALADSRLAEPDGDEPTTALVSLGRPLDGIDVRIDGDGELGEVCVRSPSLAVGYWDDPVATSTRFSGGELHTGDIGFERDGELFVAGRADDLLNVGGRSVYAGEIEAALSAGGALRPGCCALLDVSAGEQPRLMLLAELRRRRDDHEAVARDAARTVLRTAGLRLDECLFLPKGSLPKTPSGKVQRFRARQLATAGDIDAAARVELT
jgi:acyl-CoA synthetase (AMP-forming)/AMP-acid ligase II